MRKAHPRYHNYKQLILKGFSLRGRRARARVRSDRAPESTLQRCRLSCEEPCHCRPTACARSAGRFPAGNAGIRNNVIDDCFNGIVSLQECTRFIIEGNRITNCQRVGILGDFGAKVYPTARLKKGIVRNNFIAGNSASGAGTYGGIEFNSFDSLLVENNRFGFSTAHDGIAETTQAQAVFISDSISTNCLCRGNFVAVAGAANAYSNIVNVLPGNGHTIESATGFAGSTGIWDGIENPWTPVLTCATPGNLNVVYSSQFGGYTKKGNIVDWWCTIATSTFTHTSGESGNVEITGLPYAASGTSNKNQMGAAAMGGWTKASYTQLTADVSASTQYVQFYASGSAEAAAHLVIGDLPTGGTVTVLASGRYFV